MASMNHGVYIEGIVGAETIHNVDEQVKDVIISGSNNVYAGAIGYQFSKHWSIELGSTYFSYKGINAYILAPHLAARLSIPLGSRLTVFAKAGGSVQLYSVDGRYEPLGAVYAGLGINIALHKGLYLTAQANNFLLPIINFNSSDFNIPSMGLIGGGIGYHF